MSLLYITYTALQGLNTYQIRKKRSFSGIHNNNNDQQQQHSSP